MATVKAMTMELFALDNQSDDDLVERNSHPFQFSNNLGYFEKTCKHFCKHVEWCLANKEYAKACNEESIERKRDVDQSFLRKIICSVGMKNQEEFAEFGIKCSTKVLKS